MEEEVLKIIKSLAIIDLAAQLFVSHRKVSTGSTTFAHVKPIFAYWYEE